MRGKVVVLDLWAEGCSGCIVLSREIHQSLSGLLKERNDLVVVSVSTQPDVIKWKRAIKKYSHDEFINVHMDAYSRVEFDTYYERTYQPYVQIIDRNGKIISTTVNDITGIEQLVRAALQLH